MFCRFDGDLVISVDPGLEVTIPNHELISPYIDIDSNGEEYIKNSSDVRLTAFSMGQQSGQNSISILGRSFLSAAYLMVDEEQKQFTLWQGAPSQEQNLVAVGQSLCSPSITSPTPISTATPTSSPPPSQKGLSKGAIVGVSVGAVGTTVALFGVLLFAWKRKRTRSRGHHKLTEKTEHTNQDLVHPKAELVADNHPPQEMPLGANHLDSALVFEKGGDARAAELPEGHQTSEMPGSYELSEMPCSTPYLKHSSMYNNNKNHT